MNPVEKKFVKEFRDFLDAMDVGQGYFWALDFLDKLKSEGIYVTGESAKKVSVNVVGLGDGMPGSGGKK